MAALKVIAKALLDESEEGDNYVAKVFAAKALDASQGGSQITKWRKALNSESEEGDDKVAKVFATLQSGKTGNSQLEQWRKALNSESEEGDERFAKTFANLSVSRGSETDGKRDHHGSIEGQGFNRDSV